MSRYAVISADGVVQNIIEAPTGFDDPLITIVPCDETVQRGDLYDGSGFRRPPADTGSINAE
jgi:hypothetical protein